MHSVLQTFTSRFLEVLEDTGVWDDATAWQHLLDVVHYFLPPDTTDPHWQAEMARLLEEKGALLREWLRHEKQRYQEGWCWLETEASFAGLQTPRLGRQLSGAPRPHR